MFSEDVMLIETERHFLIDRPEALQEHINAVSESCEEDGVWNIYYRTENSRLKLWFTITAEGCPFNGDSESFEVRSWALDNAPDFLPTIDRRG